MIAVDVQYRPLGFLPAARKSFFLPVRWSELSEQQLENVSLVLNPDVNEDILISLILRMSRLFARRLDSYQKFSILRQLKYLRQSDTCDMFIITRLSGLHAPERYLRNVTFGQFIFGDTYWLSYIDGRKEDLNNFLACFYTAGKFSDSDIEKNAALISQESRKKREAIAFNYGLIREWLAKRYKYVFEKQTKKRKRTRSNGWVGVFDAVVGDDIINADKYADTPLSQVLRYMDNKIKEQIKKN